MDECNSLTFAGLFDKYNLYNNNNNNNNNNNKGIKEKHNVFKKRIMDKNQKIRKRK